MVDPAEKEPTSELEILAQARKDFALCQQAETQPRAEYSRCLRFIALEHYPDSGAASKSDRAGAGLPSIVVDQCNPAANQIINDWIRNRMGIQIGPADAIASEKTAKVFNGYVRNLEYLNHARQHYDTAFRNLVRGGRGYIGALTRRKKGSFKQELCIRSFPDSQSVYIDPYWQELDMSDNNMTFVRQTISQASAKEEFGKDVDCDFADWGPEYGDWVTKEAGGVIAEYWKAKYIPRKLQKLTQAIPVQRGSRRIVTDEVYDDEYDALPEGVTIAKDPGNGGVLMEEDEPRRVIIFRKITGKNILSETEWPGHIIPIVPMIAKSIIVDGEKKIFSAISGGLDPQCLANYAMSSIAAEMGSETYVPWVGALGQFRSQRQAWMDLNIKRVSFIEYDPVAVGDKLVPPPQKPNHEPQIVAFSNAFEMAQNSFRVATGINKSSLGIEDGRALSGIAKKTLISEGDNNTFDFPDAGANALEILGNILVDVGSKIVPEAELLQILDEQEKQVTVMVNAPLNHPQMPKDQTDEHWLDQGEYKVRVSAAPSHQTMRQETEEKMMDIYKDAPDLQKAALLAPIIREMAFNGKEEIADRVELPEYRKPKDGQLNIPPEAQAVIAQGQQMIQAGEQHIALLEKERDSKILELQSKEKIEAIRGETQIAIARIAAEAKTGIAAFEGEIEHIRTVLDTILAHNQMQHEAALQQNAQEHQAGLQESAQRATAGQTTQAAAAAANGNGAQ